MFYFRLWEEQIEEIVEQGSLDQDEIFPAGEPNNYNIRELDHAARSMVKQWSSHICQTITDHRPSAQ